VFPTLGFLLWGAEIIRSFRRARFNWPLEVADPFEDDPTNSNVYAYGATTSPTMPTASVPTSSNPELPIISLTQSISATDSLHINSSPIPPNRPHVADVFEGNKAKMLRPTKSNIFLRPSSPLGKLPQRRYDAMKAKVKSKSKPATPQSTSDVDLSGTNSDKRSGSVTPTPLPSRSSTPTHSSKGSSTEKLAGAITESFATYRREEPVHIRTIRVFEAVKEG